jgi:hypothetical protein
MSVIGENVILERAKSYVRDVGIPVADRPVSPEKPWRWDGKVLASDFEGRTKKPVQMLVHEANHWLISSKRRRKEPDYGLGRGPTSYTAPDEVIVALLNEEERMFEEQVIATYDVLIMQELGLCGDELVAWWLEVWDMYAHRAYVPQLNGAITVWAADGAIENNMDRFDRVLAKLRRLGLMTPERDATLARMLGDVLPHTDRTMAWIKERTTCASGR